MQVMKTQELPTRAKSVGLKRILVPVDFSPLAKKALHYAFRLARQFKAQISLLHVVEPEPPPAFDGYITSPHIPAWDSSEDETKQLKALVADSARAGIVNVNSTIRYGLASHEIVDAAKQLDIDLIVIATHGYTGWRHFCIGSTAERVVRAAPCPVLVVREKERDFC